MGDTIETSYKIDDLLTICKVRLRNTLLGGIDDPIKIPN